MPAALRLRVALLTLLGVFLIPIGMSSLRGLTHVLTCSEATEVPFTVETPADGPATIASSAQYERGAPEGVCGGLVLDMQVISDEPGKLVLRLPISNRSEYDWQGTVKLQIGDTSVPVAIGEIRSKGIGADTIEVNVPKGSTELNGSLLIGP